MAEYGKSLSSSNAEPNIVNVYEGRLTEDFLLQQHDYYVGLETYRTGKRRLERNDMLYRGQIGSLFPDETALPDEMLVQNQFKNSLHDHTRLASEGRGMPKFIPRGDREADRLGARVRESVCDTYWRVGRGKYLSRELYMDLGGAGMMAVFGYYNKRSIYPQYMRLNPRFCFPDVRNGKLYAMLYMETVRERVAAHENPDIKGLNPKADNNAEVDFVAYYDAEEVVECFIRRAPDEGHTATCYIKQRWRHDLEIVPVAFHKLPTYDGAPRGLFDQLDGPMMVRNKAVRFVVDYMEQTAYSPLFAMNIENADEDPGPTTVYRGDPDAEPGTVKLERIGPATSGGTMWNLISYMGDQEEREAMQPPGRVGLVPQSQASGSFVDSTQGQLQSVVLEMQEGMSDLREQLDTILNKIDEKYLDVTKPLVRAVGKKKTYTPSKDINQWYIHTIEYGASAGLGKLQTDNRIENLVAARLLDRGTGMEQIDFVDDSSIIQERIDMENVGDALLQRFAMDPTTPISSLAQVSVLMEMEGKSKIEALQIVAPALFQAEQAARGVPPTEPGQPGQPGAEPAAPAGPEGALPAQGQGETPVPQLPKAPMQQLFGPVRG